MPEIAVAFAPGSARTRYALGVLLDLLGLTWREVAPGDEADVGYGNAEGRVVIPAGPQELWDDPRPSLERDGDLPIVHRPGGPARVRGGNASALGFDALYATYACLTGAWEKADPANEVGHPRAAEGWLCRHGLLHEPLVHRYAAAVRDALAAAGVRCALPPPCVVLTHDVDFNFRERFAARERWVRLKRGVTARRVAGLARALVRPAPPDTWDEWRRLADAHGGRPTYFVASYGLFDPGSDANDPPYDVRHPEVASTLRRLAAEGAELGVQFSLQARRSPDQIRLERERLEEVLGSRVRSARHHWWALGRPAEPTLAAQARAGIELDCSFGLTDRTGFRRGIAYPFRPFDPVAESALPIWSLPTVAMDIAVFNDRTTTRDAAADLASLVAAVRAHGGGLVLDWHAHALAHPGGAGRGIADLLDSVADLRLYTPLELVANAEQRRGRANGQR